MDHCCWMCPLTVKITREYKRHPCGSYLFLYKFIYSNWRLTTLQYCIGFAIHWHESAMGVHVFPILNPPPTFLSIPSLWVIPVHQPRAPCIMHQTWISFTYDILHVSMPFSHIIPPSPSPTESKRLFYTNPILKNYVKLLRTVLKSLSQFNLWNTMFSLRGPANSLFKM